MCNCKPNCDNLWTVQIVCCYKHHNALIVKQKDPFKVESGKGKVLHNTKQTKVISFKLKERIPHLNTGLL